MHFQYGPCDSKEIYEKRVYRCLGQWADKDSATIFTLTKRADNVVDVFECFVGINNPNRSEKQIIIKEAGESCYKKLNVENFGMEMNQTGKVSLSKDYSLILINRTLQHHVSQIMLPMNR